MHVYIAMFFDANLGWSHDLVDAALGGLTLAVAGLGARFLGRIQALENAQDKHSLELRDTRQAVSRIEGHLDLTPFPYQGD